MSLGVRTLWRARAISHACSPIPREPAVSTVLRPSTNNNLPALRRVCVPFSRRLMSDVSNTRPGPPVTNDEVQSRPPAANQAVTQATFAQRLAMIPVRPHDAPSILVRTRMEYPSPKETQLNEYRRHRDMEAQTRHEALARKNHKPLQNWRLVLQELTATTPRYMNGVVRVLMPKAASDALLNPDVANSLWNIRSRTQAYMVVEQERDEDGNAVLKISGTRTSVENAIEDVVQVAKKVKVLLVSNFGETIIIHDGIQAEGKHDPSGAGTQIIIGNRRFLASELLEPHRLGNVASQVQKPSRWTAQSLEQYVAILTRGFLPVWRASQLYPGRKLQHQQAVVKQLVDVFYDPETQASLSAPAFKIALGYLARQGRTSRTNARLLVDRMEQREIPTDTTVFNLLLEATIPDKDLRSFKTCVYLMIRRGHEPNVKTWLLFLRLVQSEEVRRYILQAMVHKNLLFSPETVAQVAFEMAPYDAERAMLQGLDVEAFLAEQNNLYGPDWLKFGVATLTCNRIIEVMAQHGKWDHVAQFADFMASKPSHYVYPDPNTFNICVEHARVQTYARTAISMVRRFASYGIQPEMGTLRSLFMAFWYHNMVHAMNVVWQYSLLTGKTTNEMADRVAYTLTLGAKRGWDAESIPMQCDSIPTKKEHSKQYAFYALLKVSAERMFHIRDSVDRKHLLQIWRGRGLKMRKEGHVVTLDALSSTLLDAAERDSRFHKTLTKGKWAIAPAMVPTVMGKPRGVEAKASDQDSAHEEDGKDDGENDRSDEDHDEETIPEDVGKHNDIVI